MKILLSFYPDIKINQLSDHTATYWLSNDYDLFIDTNANPGSWSAQRKRGTLRTDLMLRGGRVPADDVAKADALIKRYQDALVSWVMDVEEREKGGIKKDVEVLKWHRKHMAQPATPADPEESQAQDEDKALAAQRLEENLEEYLVLTKGPEKPINPALPEEPNLEEIQEAPGEEEEIQPEIRSIKPLLPPLLGPIISPLAYQEYRAKGLDVGPLVSEAVEKALKKEEETGNLVFRQVFEPVLSFNAGDSVELEFNKNINPKIQTMLKDNIIKNIDAVKLQAGESYKDKIEVKIKEIIQALETEIYIIQSGECEEEKDPEREKRISKIMENFEVLRLLQDCQDLQAVQEKELGKQERDTSVSDVNNEVYINKNGKGYSWRITARAADMEMAVRYALFANEMCKEILKKGDGDNES